MVTKPKPTKTDKTLEKTVHDVIESVKAQKIRSDPKGEFASFGEFLKATSKLNNPDVRLRALNEGSGAEGEFLVPEEFRAQIMLKAASVALIRPRAQVLPVTTSSLRIPVAQQTDESADDFGGVSMVWVDEAASLAIMPTPKLSQIRLVPKKLLGIARVSEELVADSPQALEEVLTSIFGLALARKEDRAFITGVGLAIGIVQSDALITIAKESGQAANSIVAENLVKMYARMLPTSKPNAIWLLNPDVMEQLWLNALVVTVIAGGGGAASMLTTGGPSGTLIMGRPAFETTLLPTLGDANDIMFIDPSYYVIGDREALTVESSPDSDFVNGNIDFRFRSRVTGMPWITSAITPENGTKTLSPFVTLAVRA